MLILEAKRGGALHPPCHPPAPKANPASRWHARQMVSGRFLERQKKMRFPPHFCYTYNMALVSALEVPPELLELFQKLISTSNNRRTGAVRKHGYLQSRKKILNLTTRSLLPQIRDLRDSLSPSEVEAWRAAAAASNMNYWNLFVQDTAYRLKYDIPGLATPSVYHSYKVGRIEIKAPAERVLLAQYHPYRYWVNKKIRGNTTQREDIEIIEKLVLPLDIGTSYRAELTPTREDYTARFYAIIYSSYQGRTIETEVGFDLDLSTDWKRTIVTSSEVIGVARYYNLWIELDGVRGWFEWDNVLARHTGTNYARDYRCTDVNNELTRVNWQIEKSWEEQFLPFNTAFDSVYPED